MISLAGPVVLFGHGLLHFVALTIVGTGVGALVLNAVYNRYFHPLRHFPGPFWASVTDLWKLYICMGKESHIAGMKLHKIYGCPVSIIPYCLYID